MATVSIREIRNHGGEVVDGHRAVLRSYGEIDAADEIAANACLVELDREHAVFDGLSAAIVRALRPR